MGTGPIYEATNGNCDSVFRLESGGIMSLGDSCRTKGPYSQVAMIWKPIRNNYKSLVIDFKKLAKSTEGKL